MLENSRWHQLDSMLVVFPKIQPFYTNYERLSQMVILALTQTPVFLLPRIIDCIIHLLLINKRSLELLITIREKILNSKYWAYRKNYILIYRALKVRTCFEYHKILPNLVYKSIILEKSYGVKITFLQVTPDI